MGKLKYAFSVIVLIGVTVAFSFAFEAYTESDYENKDGDIRRLTLNRFMKMTKR